MWTLGTVFLICLGLFVWACWQLGRYVTEDLDDAFDALDDTDALGLDDECGRHPGVLPDRDTPGAPVPHRPAVVDAGPALGALAVGRGERAPGVPLDAARDEVRRRLVAQQEQGRRERAFQQKGF